MLLSRGLTYQRSIQLAQQSAYRGNLAVTASFFNCQSMAFATKIMGGSTSNTKDSAGRRLGIKKWGHTTEIMENDIIARQRGFKWHPGMHVRAGKDHTLHAEIEVSDHCAVVGDVKMFSLGPIEVVKG